MVAISQFNPINKNYLEIYGNKRKLKTPNISSKICDELVDLM
jgi:hypothetical protein